jgi:rhodanese-related sulfurtransferase
MPPKFRFLIGQLHDSQVADDLLQDTFIKAIFRRDEMKKPPVKRSILTMLLIALLTSTPVHADEKGLSDYLLGFDYAARKEMKTNSSELVQMLAAGKAQLIDIRFKEEYEAWHMGIATSIPLSELPQRLGEIDKNKVIVTACPHKDRAIIAMVYLKTKGFKVKYLQDGLLGLADYLRGDNASSFIHSLNQRRGDGDERE